MTRLLAGIVLMMPVSFGQGLCPGSHAAPEMNSALGALEQVGKLIPAGNAAVQLGMVDLEAQGVCQYWIYLPEKRQKLIFADVQGTIRLTATVPMSSSELRPLPDGFLDLPAAIEAARKQGMLLPLDSAKLMMAQPRGKPAVAVWTLTPRRDPAGRVLSYFISAADAGRPLALSDVTDYFRDYNQQWRHIVDMFHSMSQQASQATQPEHWMEGQPCVTWSTRMSWRHGHWKWNQFSYPVGYICGT